MRNYTIDELAVMPEAKAIEKYFHRRNYSFLLWTWPSAVLTYFVLFIETAVDGAIGSFVVATAGLALLLLMFFFRAHERFERHFDLVFCAFLIMVPLGIVGMVRDDEFGFIFPATIAPLFLVFTRLRPSRLLPVSGIYVAASVLAAMTGSAAPSGSELWMMPLMTNGLFAATGLFITRRRRIAFSKDWSYNSRREAERARMREELADARKIQLSMLPASPPPVSWIDISSVSNPATEVGGDFYEYFQLDEHRVVIAIGDVAGHGVGSGLVLAGIKSGLHLLREELSDPVQVVCRLNRLAAEWLQWRMLVTLLIAIVDRDERTVRVVCAGHPPLIVAGEGDVREIGGNALPLGTRLDPLFEEETTEIHDGDTILVYTDGLTEAPNETGDQYGVDRLADSFRRAVTPDATALDILSAMMDDVDTFIRDVPQQDDLSFVVARLDMSGNARKTHHESAVDQNSSVA